MQILLYRLEDARIRFQLCSVERYLRRRGGSSLSASSQRARQQHLDQLRAYWQAGRFPRNRVVADRITPCFIDGEGRVCAVGHLLIASQESHLGHQIARTANEARIHDLAIPELAHWAEQAGLSVDELALIQPGYCPVELQEGMRPLLNAGLLSVLASLITVVAHITGWRRLTTRNLATPLAWMRRISLALAGILAGGFALFTDAVQRSISAQFNDGFSPSPSLCLSELMRWNQWFVLIHPWHLPLAFAATGLSCVALILFAGSGNRAMNRS
jgi:hypothetical protein